MIFWDSFITRCKYNCPFFSAGSDDAKLSHLRLERNHNNNNVNAESWKLARKSTNQPAGLIGRRCKQAGRQLLRPSVPRFQNGCNQELREKGWTDGQTFTSTNEYEIILNKQLSYEMSKRWWSRVNCNCTFSFLRGVEKHSRGLDVYFRYLLLFLASLRIQPVIKYKDRNGLLSLPVSLPALHVQFKIIFR